MIKEIAVKLNLTKNPANVVAAVADVTLDLGEEGSLKVCGFRVLAPDGKPPWVSAPARQGKTAWFDVVTMHGPVKRLVETAVLEEYQRARKTPAKK